MSRTATEGLVLVKEKDGAVAIIEINSETTLLLKIEEFIEFCKSLSEINFSNKGDLKKLKNSKMKNGEVVKDSLVNLIAKIGEKITIRRANFFDSSDGNNFFYVHSAIEKNIGKIISLVKLDGIEIGKNDSIGNKIAMHIAASNPLAINKNDIDKNIVDKEFEIIKAETVNSGKPKEIADKIANGKINKFLNDNSLLNQIWIMDSEKVSEILEENSNTKKLKILNFIRYKVGEGV